MPVATTRIVTMDQVKKGDTIWPNSIQAREVAKIRHLAVNVEFTFTDGTTKRLPKSSDVSILRSEETEDEKWQKLVDLRDAAVERIVAHAAEASANGDAPLREKFTNEKRALFSILEWSGEETLVECHIIALWIQLHNTLERHQGPRYAIIVEWLDELKNTLVSWTPGRSTSVMSNLSEDCRYKAMQAFVLSRNTAAGYDFAQLLFLTRELAKRPVD